MSPLPPPRPPQRPGSTPGRQPPREPREPQHPAERGDQHPAERGPPPGTPQRAGRFFEIRKGKSGSSDSLPREDEEPPIASVALPRSITQEQEQADLKARLGRDELVDIDKRDSRVRVKDIAPEPRAGKRRTSQMWLLLLVALLALAAIVAERLHLFRH